MNLTSFVDDKGTMASGATAKETLEAKRRTDKTLTEFMLEEGIVLSAEKEYNVVEGPNRNALQWLRAQLPNTVDDARYLGMRHAATQGGRAEILHRDRAMKTAWLSLLPLFRSDVKLEFKMDVYRATVMNAGLSGLEISVGFKQALTRNDVAGLRAMVNRHLKVMMRGGATRKKTLWGPDGQQTIIFNSMTTEEMMRRCKVVPFFSWS